MMHEIKNYYLPYPHPLDKQISRRELAVATRGTGPFPKNRIQGAMASGEGL
jgi:hypothetical protein